MSTPCHDPLPEVVRAIHYNGPNMSRYCRQCGTVHTRHPYANGCPVTPDHDPQPLRYGVSMMEIDLRNRKASAALEWLDDMTEADAWSVVMHYFDGRRHRELFHAIDGMRADAAKLAPDWSPEMREIL